MKKNVHILNLLVIWVAFLFLLAVVLFVGRNIVYSRKGRSLYILGQDQFQKTSVRKEEADTLLLYQEDMNEQGIAEELSATLEQMKIPYDQAGMADFDAGRLDDYSRLVLAFSDYDSLGDNVYYLSAWVQEGGSLMIAYPPDLSPVKEITAEAEPEDQALFNEITELLSLMGVESLDDAVWARVKGFCCIGDFMPGGQRQLSISTPYESSLSVSLKSDCTIYMTSTDKKQVPLIWKRELGDGEVVVDNLGFMEKAYRGFHAAAYTLMGDYTIWPVINGSTFYIDDFPSPVPPGDSYQIRQDYGVDIKDFYTQVWWRDVSNLAKRYNVPYTGLIIEMYSNQVSGALPRQTDTTRFEYFGNMLLEMGGELGIHGYNHMPLVLENFDYLGKYESYHQWISEEEMRASIEEVMNFSHELFPDESFSVYVPPSNIISDEGRRILAEDFPEISCIASLYIPDQNDVSYATDFEITEDGLIQTPRITSGYVLDDYMRTAALSELYLHCVNTHFQHPDDVLDVDRGANLGWEELFSRFEDYVDWLYDALPQIRSLTGSELAGAVQRYSNIEIARSNNSNEIRVSLDGFADEAWFYLKMNDGSPGKISGGTWSDAGEDLYLIQATSPEITIEIER